MATSPSVQACDFSVSDSSTSDSEGGAWSRERRPSDAVAEDMGSGEQSADRVRRGGVGGTRSTPTSVSEPTDEEDVEGGADSKEVRIGLEVIIYVIPQHVWTGFPLVSEKTNKMHKGYALHSQCNN